jgi:DNA-binding beta-propeller fold protein YncE
VIALLALAAAAAAQPETVLTIDPKHRLIEGVASDGATIWVSSVLDRQILACRSSCRTLATFPAPLHPFALAWDRTRKRLWVAADCPPGIAAIKPCERGALIGLDTRGRIQTRIAPKAGAFHPGDVSATDGRVFVSDSQNGLVFALLPAGRAMMTVNLPGDGKSAQGTALTPDGKKLVVADYSRGVGLVDPATFKTTALPRQDGKPLRGIDGMTRCGSTYYGIYNGTAPGRLVSFTLGDARLTMDEPIPNLKLPDPTQVTYDGKRLLIVADSGWATLDNADFKRTAGAPIVAVPLSGDCTS